MLHDNNTQAADALPGVGGLQLFSPIADAVISADELYRYQLRRIWDPSRPLLVWAMLNPSKADGKDDDNTVRICCSRARRLGYGGILIINLFAWRSKDPSALATVADPVGPDNDRWIARTLAEHPRIVCAWGDGGELHGRGKQLRELLELVGVEPLRILLTKGGNPCHPLRKALDLPLVRWTE